MSDVIDPALALLDRTLMIFARDPAPGRVKTRLAVEVGDDVAVEMYRALGRHVVDQVRSGPYRTEVHYTPENAEPSLRTWLGSDRIDFVAQWTGSESIRADLGARLEYAFRKAFHSADRVIAIGTDAPDVGAEVIETAFTALGEHDAVIGPAHDGGYYLLGLRAPLPELFRAVPWGSGRVFETTIARLDRMHRSVYRLPVRSDVDRRSDLDRIAWDGLARFGNEEAQHAPANGRTPSPS